MVFSNHSYPATKSDFWPQCLAKAAVLVVYSKQKQQKNKKKKRTVLISWAQGKKKEQILGLDFGLDFCPDFSQDFGLDFGSDFGPDFSPDFGLDFDDQLHSYDNCFCKSCDSLSLQSWTKVTLVLFKMELWTNSLLLVQKHNRGSQGELRASINPSN